MHIRMMRDEDCGPVASVLNHAIERGVAHFGTIRTNEDDVRADWIATRDRYPWIVATSENGSFLGFAKGSSWKSRRAYDWTLESGIYIVDGAQGRGVGRALYTRLFEILKAQGYRVVLAGVSVPNPASERLHESLGFRCVGDIEPAGYKHGQWVAVRMYQLMLASCGPDDVPTMIRSVDETLGTLGQEEHA